MKSETNENKWLHGAIDGWLKYSKLKVCENTSTSYLYTTRLIKKSMPNAIISDIEAEDIQDLFILLADMGYSKSQIHQVKIVLNQVFNYFYRKTKILLINPIQYTVIPEYAHTKTVMPLTKAEQKKVEEACYDDIHGDIFLFLLKTGLRRSELCNLKWSDYDDTHGTIRVHQSKTKAGVRTIPLLPVCRQIIAFQLHTSEWIFSTIHGNQMTPASMKKTYTRLRKKSGVQTLTNHVCRHTFATRLLEKEANPKAISALLGHTSVAFTLDRYVDAQKEYLCRQIELINDGSLLPYKTTIIPDMLPGQISFFPTPSGLANDIK